MTRKAQTKATTEKKYVSYYRVSTSKQGESGLGLAAQKAMVQNFVKCENCIIASFTEVESGKQDNRPELEKAIAYAKQQGATLVIAKLDRLSRNAAFIFTLKDTGVDFICADMPEANVLTIGIFAVMAQHERETISRRTKEALQAKKEREPDWRPGTPANLTDEARKAAAETNKAKAQANGNNRQAAAHVKSLRDKLEDGKQLTWREIADRLNKGGFKTSTGGTFQATQAMRLYSE